MLLSSPSMQVAVSFLRKVICEPMQPHGDAAQLAAHACRKVRSELWQRNLFRRTKRGVQKNNKRRTCEKMLKQKEVHFVAKFLEHLFNGEDQYTIDMKEKMMNGESKIEYDVITIKCTYLEHF